LIIATKQFYELLNQTSELHKSSGVNLVWKLGGRGSEFGNWS